MKAPFDGPKEGKASLLAAVQDYREVIADKQAAGESPSLVVWAKLSDALQQLGALESGSTGSSRLNEAISIDARFLYPYDPVNASRDWFVLQNWMAKALLSVGERKSNLEIVCQAYARAIVAERGLAERADPDVLAAQYNALQVLESMKTRFGEQKSSDCQAAEREFVRQFGP